MERTKGNVTTVNVSSIVDKSKLMVEPKLKWKKLGGGSLRLGTGGKRRIIKPGEIFTASLNEIPSSFLSSLQCLSTDEQRKAAEVAPPVSLGFSIKLRSAGYYDVVNADGKPLNDKALRKEAAEELLKSLQ